MGTTLTGTTPQDTYDSLIKVTDNGPLSGTAKYLSDGLGNDSVLALSTSAVGINYTSPARALHIVSNSPQIRISDTAAPTTNFWEIQSAFSNTNQDFLIGNQSGAALTINASRNVGIGTSLPASKLYIVDNSPLVVGSSSGSISVTEETGTTSIGQGGGIFLGIPASSGSFLSTFIKASRESTDGSNSSAALLFGTRVSGGANTERMRITSDGYLRLATGGIQFNGDTAAANALDDYEEGTWTATLTDGTVTKTATCNYTKIGRMVYLAGGVSNVEDPSSFTGNVYITGVPFVPAFSVSLYGINNYLDTASVFVPYLESNQQIKFYKVGAATADYVQMQGSDLNSYSDIIFAGQFTV